VGHRDGLDAMEKRKIICPSWLKQNLFRTVSNLVAIPTELLVPHFSISLHFLAYLVPRGSYRITYLLTELSPSSEAANCAATQELPSILWNPKVHHRVHNSPPLVPILSQIDPVHTIPSYLSKIYFHIVHPPTS
jgi:hypothetical protein